MMLLLMHVSARSRIGSGMRLLGQVGTRLYTERGEAALPDRLVSTETLTSWPT